MRRLVATVVSGVACALPSAAGAADGGGGAGGAEYGAVAPTVSAWSCRTACVDAGTARAGSLLRLRGSALRGVATVTFLGGRGGRDDVAARALESSPRSVVVQVPAGAVSGPVRVALGAGVRAVSPASRVSVRISTPATGAVSPSDPSALRHVFPVAGPHTYGGASALFGAGRAGHTHQGQDVLAACGTPLVAALGGVVRWAGFEADAGNYVVIDGEGTDVDYVYMHLRAAPRVARGAAVATGAPLGEVGATGDASGCHLHFELWSGPGWYEGGRPFDPLPLLRAWDAG